MTYPSDLNRYPVIAYDTETTGLNYPKDKAFAFSIAVSSDEAYYYDVRRTPMAARWFNGQIKKYIGTIVCHNAGFDACMSKTIGIDLPLDQLDDTAIRACLINEHEATLFPWQKSKPGDYSLDNLAWKYLKRRKLEIDIKNIANLPFEKAQDYGKEDVKITLLLWLWQEEQRRLKDLNQIFEFERSIMPAIIKRQMNGVRVDIAAAERAMYAMDPVIKDKQARLENLTGVKVNVNSAPQVAKLFKLDGDPDTGYSVDGVKIGITDKGAPSFKAEYLRDLAEVNPIADLIVQIRSDIKTRDTFLGTHILGHHVDGVVYPTINQVAGETGGTRTGRLSYVSPALQQIPSRDKRVAALVKPCFIPNEGNAWLSFDLASFEVRVFAALVGQYDGRIVGMYQSNPSLDFHGYVSELTGLVRNAEYPGQPNAKQLNLSMIFCQGKGATAAKMGMPVTQDTFKDEFTGATVKFFRAGPEADRVIEAYHRRIPGVRKLSKQCIRLLQHNTGTNNEKHPWIATDYGRRIRFPKMFKHYKASGLLIQATAADINKENWKILDDGLSNMGANLILNTHDSYEIEAPIDQIIEVRDKVKYLLEREYREIPLLADYNGCGLNWWDALNGIGVEHENRQRRSSTNK